MKVYSKPIVTVETIDDINEPVYLISGEKWVNSDCFVAKLKKAQIPELGRNSIIMQIDARHIAGTAAYANAGMPLPGHHNEHQYFIFKFKSPISNPGKMSGFINGMDLEFSDDGTKCRCVHRYHSNANESIGAGDWTMTLYFDGTQITGDALSAYLPVSFQCWDMDYYPDHTYCDNPDLDY